MNYESIAEKKT